MTGPGLLCRRAVQRKPEMNLRKLGLKSKIVIGFGSLLAIIAGMSLIGYRSAVISEKTSQ
jgi:hypothetical protein